MGQLRVRDHILAVMSTLFVLLFTLVVADAKGPGQLPNVMVLATGGTIAGTVRAAPPRSVTPQQR
jgi:L-asparaginase/Glu-tRNA(Gln) amidotransferase subunit D